MVWYFECQLKNIIKEKEIANWWKNKDITMKGQEKSENRRKERTSGAHMAHSCSRAQVFVCVPRVLLLNSAEATCAHTCYVPICPRQIIVPTLRPPCRDIRNWARLKGHKIRWNSNRSWENAGAIKVSAWYRRHRIKNKIGK